MAKYSFLDDYSEGCHPNILKALSATNFTQQTAYGDDEYSIEAKQLIRKRLNNMNAGVYFVSGGTQANLIITSSILKSHEAIISAEIGHILGREAGAIEATGHKIISMKTENGKLSTDDLQLALNNHTAIPHMVKPKMVYISNATEIGTIYTKQELKSIYRFCKEKQLYLFLDGARLATALSCEKNDLTLEDLSILTDIFYIGGTKNGALIGEAIVINNPALNDDFPFHIKQRGAMIAKGRLLGLQFLELFKKNLYFELAGDANILSKKLSQGIEKKGYSLSAATETNQIFAIFPNELINRLDDNFAFYIWEKKDKNHSVVRLVTSWSTNEKEIDKFIENL
jgi:threonine aldolase